MSSTEVLNHILNGVAISIVLGLAAVFYLFAQRICLPRKLDPREPPPLKPRIPYIGHLIDMYKYGSEYYNQLNEKYPMQICTLPTLLIHGKQYVITSPTLVQSALRSKDLSFEPFMVNLAQGMLDMSDEAMAPIWAPGTEEKPKFISEFIREIHGAMLGEHLHKMNAVALNDVAAAINGLGDTFEPESLYLWLRHTLTIATCNALLGSHNPMRSDSSLVDALWDFEHGLTVLFNGFFPSYFAPKAYKGRARLQCALAKYYNAKHDLEPDVARMTKARAALYRRYGISDTDIGNFELSLLHVSTANAMPTLFWFLLFIISDPALTFEIQEELLKIITETGEKMNGKRVFNLDITKFEINCPLLLSAYRETIRLANSQIGIRSVMRDTFLSDGKHHYLLREGADVRLPAGVTHMDPKTWGPDAAVFKARRFLATSGERAKWGKEEKEREWEQKRALLPFGGGKHLCPGRNFAFAEILGTVSVLVLGFEVRGKAGKVFEVPEVPRTRLGEGVGKPSEAQLEMGARLTRREGWQDIFWRFVVDKA